MTDHHDEALPAGSRDDDLALLAAGGYTGWWDEQGRPAPWPEDFFDPSSGWQPAGSDTPAPTNGGPAF